MEIRYLEEQNLFEINHNGIIYYYNDDTNAVSTDPNNVDVHLHVKRNEKNVYNLKILPSNVCNLDCEYCYSHEDRNCNEVLQYNERLEKILDDIDKKDWDEIAVSFTGGGEPTTNFSCIRKIVEKINGFHGKHRLNITSNGLFDQEAADFLIKNNFCFAISIDGSFEIESSQQRRGLEREKYNSSLMAAKRLLESGCDVSILTVLSANTLMKYKGKESVLLNNTAEYFYQLGFKTMVLSFDYEIYYSKNEELIQTVIDFCKVCIKWKQSHKGFMLAIRDVFVANKNKSTSGICRGIGDLKNNITILPNGELSFCHRVQDSRYIFSNYTDEGIKEFRTSEKIEDLLRKAQNHKIDCKSCIARQICMGDICPAILIDTSEEKIAQNCINRRHIRETLLEYALNGNN